MMQLVGFWSWSQSGNGDISAADVSQGIELARRQMRESVFDETYRELSAGDVRFLNALAEAGGEATLAEVAKALGKPSNYASKYKTRLLKQGIIGDRGQNRLRFDMPGFLEYLLEQT